MYGYSIRKDHTLSNIWFKQNSAYGKKKNSAHGKNELIVYPKK